MRLGIGIGDTRNLGLGAANVRVLVQAAVQAEEEGLDVAWVPHVRHVDSLIAIALAGQSTSRIEFLTGVIPVYSRQPYLMAQQALSAQQAADGRLSLGLGVAHPESVPATWGQEFSRPVAYLEEYLQALLPLLSDHEVKYRGDLVRTEASLDLEPMSPPPVLLAALGPRMLRLAGRMSEGTVLWMAGPRAVETHVVPRINSAAAEAGLPPRRIVVALPVCVTDDAAHARNVAARMFARYGRLVNYQRILDIEGVSGPQGVVIVGSESSVEEQLRGLAAAGATDFLAAPFALSREDAVSVPRTRTLLRGLLGRV